MSSYIIKVKNTSGTEGTVIADAGFSYTDRLNELNEGQLKITGTSVSKRGLFEIGSEVYIYRNGTLEFHGLINSLSYLDAGGISADLKGYEIWLGKENGDYSSSPWTSTASATIFNSIIGESNYFTAGTVEAGSSVDFRVEATSSLWNAISSLLKRTDQDMGIDYANTEIDILDHKGSSTSVATLNDRVQIKDMTVRQSYPIANDVRVYGKSEGETRIKSDHTTYGQDATSKSNYGTIRKIYDDPTVNTQSEADNLADKLVAKWKDPVKIYEFDVINPNLDVESGDVVNLNSSTKGLSNEEVRIVAMERGIRNGQEFLTLQVTNKEYSTIQRSVDKMLAELENRASDLQNYDQYSGEYSNQHIGTCVGGDHWFESALACISGASCFTDALADILGQDLIGSGVCGCTGTWTYMNGNLSVPAGVVQACLLNINANSIYNYIDGDLILTGCLTVGAYTLPNTDGTSGQVLCTDGSGTLSWGAGSGGGQWADATNPYITPCNSCAICMDNNIVDGASLNCLGINSSPGAWKEVHALCVLPATCLWTPSVCGTTIVRGPTLYGTTLVCGATLCGTTQVRGAAVCSTGNVVATSTIQGSTLNINISTAANCISGDLDVSGLMDAGCVCGSTCVRGGVVCGATCVTSGTGVITDLDGTCVCASRRLRLPVGVNCY